MQRADQQLLSLGLVPTRSQAAQLIRSGRVNTVDGKQVTKPGKNYPDNTQFTISGDRPYVGRGGDKLAGFFQEHPINLDNKAALDIGASTGGFTDYLLRNGVASVTCLDVGHSQLHPSLREAAEVTNIEGVNARDLDELELPRQSYDIIVMDLSFISLRLVLEGVWDRLGKEGHLIVLVKPQFETGPELATKHKGIIHNPTLRQEICKNIKAFAQSKLTNSEFIALEECCIKGGDGNQEYFMCLRRAWGHPRFSINSSFSGCNFDYCKLFPYW